MNEKICTQLPLASAAEPLVENRALKRSRRRLVLTDYPAGGRGNRFKDLAGRRFGRWLVLDRVARSGKWKLAWYCRCDCGTENWVNPQNLRLGKTKSCGCWQSEMTSKRFRTHGKTKTPEYRIWSAMKKRCTDTKNIGYRIYGGRGIKVCESWMNSFPNFISDMGTRPSSGHSIERKNVNGNYEPSNCCWATRAEQAKNYRRTEYYRFIDKLKALGFISYYHRITRKGVELIAGALNMQVPDMPVTVK